MYKYLCCLHDKKSDTYDGFMLFNNMSQAIRSFQQVCEKDETLGKWPEDFCFVLVSKIGYEPGEIDEKGNILKEAKLQPSKDFLQVIAEAKDFVAIKNAKNIKKN